MLNAGGLQKTADWTNNTTDPDLAYASTIAWMGVPTKNWASADNLKNYLVRETHQATITQISINTNVVPGAEPGDLIMYIWNNDSGPAGVIQHVAVVTATNGDQTKVTQHTDNHKDKGWNWDAKNNEWLSQSMPNTYAYLVHITE